MIEVLAAIYVTSFALSMMLVAWNYVVLSKQLRSESLSHINRNLKKIGMFWSVSSEDFSSLLESSIEKDASSALRSTLMLGILGLGSALGFVLLFVITLTMRLLKTNRRGRAVFHSALAKDPNLAPEQVQQLFQEYSKIA
jgi:hypothetical protein